MAQGKIITEDVKRLIAKVYIEYPKMPAIWIQNQVHKLIKSPKPDNWPGLSAVQKILHDIRLQHIPNPKDIPWSLYTLAEYDIPAYALPSVINTYAVTLGWDLGTLTIREAHWVARLYKVITNVKELTIAAKVSADNERVNEITGVPVGSLVDADIETRARTGKPGISYRLFEGGYKLVILDESINEDIEFLPLPKRLREEK
jgi:hypothetical protein